MKPRVLIVDDDRLIRAQLRDALEGPYALVEARDGEEALALLEGGDAPDVVLLDLLMPKLSGIEALPRLLALRPQARVVVVSSLGVEALVEQALKAGAAGFLVKPVHPVELHAALEQALAPQD